MKTATNPPGDPSAKQKASWWPRRWVHGLDLDLEPPPPTAAPPPLASDEVPRHAVRIVELERRTGSVSLHPFAALTRLLRRGDLVVVNDAATLPASLRGRTASGAAFELRLAEPLDGPRLSGVLFGEGDWRTRTEHRPPPPGVAIGERVQLGSAARALAATVTAVTGRRVELSAGDAGDLDALWQALYATAAPVQYAHRSDALALWSVQTAYAARPWAVEMPSAGRPLTWEILLGLARAGIGVAPITHAAGLASTGDAALDAALPWPERYDIPERTAAAIADTRARGGRVIAIGTTVVRALEAAAGRAEIGVATLVLGPATPPRIVDGLVSGLHVPGESHFELLRAFAPAAQLDRILDRARRAGLSGHELGDACLIL